VVSVRQSGMLHELDADTDIELDDQEEDTEEG
jgi:hypothetical protein